MQDTWIKLYRKSKDNGIMRDARAWQMFCWILMSIDRRTGTYTTGRFMLSEALDMNANTVKDVLKRLQQKYQVVTITSTNKFSTIQVLNWGKYQSATPQEDTTSDTNKTPTKHQQNTTKQEVKNKEIKNREIYASLDYLKELPPEEVKELNQKYAVTPTQIQIKATTLYNYCEGHGKKYKNYRAMLLNALLKDFGYRQQHPKTPEVIELSPEERERASKKIDEIRSKFFKGGSHTI